MKENKYDDEVFFDKYGQMSRSKNGLESAGEWRFLRALLPELKGMKLLDLGCGYGWHCRYAIEKGASYALGIDISEKMINKAIELTDSPLIEYKKSPIEDISIEADSFDIVISSLAMHYVENFDNICNKVYQCLKQKGYFIFSVEHPIFTACDNQSWHYNEEGVRLHWPVDKYFMQGRRNTVFLNEEVIKYHKTLTTYIGELLKVGFEITGFVEPYPSEKDLEKDNLLRDEFRRPMMLIVSSMKK